MRSVFWLILLFAAAVALAMVMGQNDATVMLFWPPYRVDMSFNLVLAAVLLGFVLVHVALRSLAALSALPSQARRWRQQQRERQVHAALLDALANQLSGRFVRARTAAQQALDHLDAAHESEQVLPGRVQLKVLAHLLAAEGAQSLQDRERRDLHLKQALGSGHLAEAVPAREGALLRAIRWAVEDRDLSAATHWLSQLPQGAARRTLALRLKLRVARLGQDNPMALETARLLAKHRAFSPVAARSIVRGLVLASLEGAHDTAQVCSVWHGLDSADRRDPDVVLAAVARLQKVADDLAETVQVNGQAREWLSPVWDAWPELAPRIRLSLVKVLQTSLDGLDPVWLARLENTQRAHPADPLLQYLAAQAFFQQKLWGKSAQLFQQSARSLTDPALRVRAWCRLAELAHERADADAELNAWREAALQSLQDVPPD